MTAAGISFDVGLEACVGSTGAVDCGGLVAGVHVEVKDWLKFEGG